MTETPPAGVTEVQDALRRVSELVARGSDREAVFGAIVAEAFTLCHVDFTALLEFGLDGEASVVAVHHGPPRLVVGERAPHIPDGLVMRVFHSRAPSRVDAYAELPGPGVARMRELGITAGAAAPILVDGRLWGLLAAMTQTGTVAAGLEHVLAGFAEIAATAVASAQAKEDLRGLAEEQSALRRIAVLAVKGAGVTEVLRAVAREASGLISDTVTTLVQFDSDGSVTVRATSGDASPSTGRIEEVIRLVKRTGVLARVDVGPELRHPVVGSAAPDARSTIAVPIYVEGQVWGVLAATAPTEAITPHTQRRLTQFADIAAAGTASALARADLRQLADQQAALRQVAELAARDAPVQDVLHAVAVQASRLADVDFTTLLRYEPDGSVEIVALSGAPASLAIGARDQNSGDGVTQRVWRTHRSARIDNLKTVPSEWSEVALGLGLTTSVGVPILIRGELWGTLVVIGRGEPLTEAIEASVTNFANLAGTAISNAQARQDLRALADEQAAFRRVAELVAHGTALDRVFGAVTGEASKLLGGSATALQRLDLDGSVTTVSAHTPSGAPSNTTTDEVAVPVIVEGHEWGVLTTRSLKDALSGEAEDRLRQFAELAAAAIANAENKAKLTASRARVIATADETRRRLQRDVHDGAQQRLVQTIITLKLALAAVVDEKTSADRVAEALYHAERANSELRDLVHGILPASLTQGGLRNGLESLIGDIGVPVELQLTAPRLSPEIETTVYFVVAEALTNVVKHAHATEADVNIDFDGATVSIKVSDDGIGGANPAAGGGLTGLADRIDAVDGSLTLTSVPAGTTVTASFPVSSQFR